MTICVHVIAFASQENMKYKVISIETCVLRPFSTDFYRFHDKHMLWAYNFRRHKSWIYNTFRATKPQ